MTPYQSPFLMVFPGDDNKLHLMVKLLLSTSAINFQLTLTQSGSTS